MQVLSVKTLGSYWDHPSLLTYPGQPSGQVYEYKSWKWTTWAVTVQAGWMILYLNVTPSRHHCHPWIAFNGEARATGEAFQFYFQLSVVQTHFRSLQKKRCCTWIGTQIVHTLKITTTKKLGKNPINQLGKKIQDEKKSVSVFPTFTVVSTCAVLWMLLKPERKSWALCRSNQVFLFSCKRIH